MRRHCRRETGDLRCCSRACGVACYAMPSARGNSSAGNAICLPSCMAEGINYLHGGAPAWGFNHHTGILFAGCGGRCCGRDQTRSLPGL